MLLDKPNIELLRLVAQCKDFPVRHAFPEVFMLDGRNTGRLLEEELLITSQDGQRYRVTQAGYALLDHAGVQHPNERYRENDPQMLLRRGLSAQVMLTLMLAGVDVFAPDMSGLEGTNIYIASSIIRREQIVKSRNVSGNTRFTGLMAEKGYVFYYVADPQERLLFKQELKTATNLLAQSRRNSLEGIRPEVVYMGADYPSLLSAVTTHAGDKATYRTAYDKFTIPAYLCPCNPDGAFQMRIMLQPDYRKRLIEAMLGPQVPNPFYQGCDGTLDGEPFILGVDMDFRRITGMVKAARSGGVKSHIFARRCQCDALLGVLSGADIKYYAISDDDILRVYSFSSFLKEPPIEPYITKEGEYIHDETIRACREARKANRKKGKASQNEN